MPIIVQHVKFKPDFDWTDILLIQNPTQSQVSLRNSKLIPVTFQPFKFLNNRDFKDQVVFNNI